MGSQNGARAEFPVPGLVWGVCVHWFSCCPPVCQSVPGVQCALAFKNRYLQFLDWQYSFSLHHSTVVPSPNLHIVELLLQALPQDSLGWAAESCLCSAGYRMPHTQTAGDSHSSPSLHPYPLPPRQKRAETRVTFPLLLLSLDSSINLTNSGQSPCSFTEGSGDEIGYELNTSHFLNIFVLSGTLVLHTRAVLCTPVLDSAWDNCGQNHSVTQSTVKTHKTFVEINH